MITIFIELGLFVALIILGIALQIRRAHDKGCSGWYILLGFIPLVNFVWYVYLLLPGDQGINMYGAPVPVTKDFISNVFNR